jgi:O-antigen/teichoic acid export membrane protein
MTFVAIFLVNAGLSFALSLVVALLLGPAGFGRYALALSVAVVINTVLFEWLRLSTTRFHSERAHEADPTIRTTLDGGYVVTAVGLASAAVLAWATGIDLGLPDALLAATAACGLTLGLFDYGTALARARFLDRIYAALVLVRGLASFVLAAGAAWLTGDPALVLAGSSVASIAALVLVRRHLARSGPGGALRRDLLLTFARYAVPLVAASAIYQLLPVVNRAILASRGGFAEAGYFSLASEIGMRLFQNLGSALDLALFQIAVRADELHGRDEAERQISRNIGFVTAILWPASVGLWLVLPSFEAVFVPPAFRGHFAPAMELMIPALAAFAVVQYALNPVFQLRARTGAVIGAAAVALVVDLGIVVGWPAFAGPRDFAAAQAAGFAGALLVLGAIAVGSGARLPWRDAVMSGIAAGGMAAALWPMRDLAPSASTLALQVGVGGLVYLSLALALNIAGARVFVGAAFARLRPARASRVT